MILSAFCLFMAWMESTTFLRSGLSGQGDQWGDLGKCTFGVAAMNFPMRVVYVGLTAKSYGNVLGPF